MASNENALSSGDLSDRNAEERRLGGPHSAYEGPLRVSPALTLIADRMRTRFGLAIEVLSRQLVPVIPADGGDLHRGAERSLRTRRELLAAMDGGRTRIVEIGSGSFVVHPLRYARAAHSVAGILAIPRAEDAQSGDGASAHQDATEPWLDFLKTAIEADLATNEGLREERLQARRTWAALRFIGQLATIDSEAELARAIVHAAAVWFDVDARLYRRDLAGDFALHTHLPGVTQAPPARLNSLLLGDRRRTVKLNAAAEAEDLGWATPEALLVPIVVDGATEWVLALGGSLPDGAQVVFETVAQAMGSHLSRLGVAHRTAIRRRFEPVMMRADHPRELVTLDSLRWMIQETGAESGVVTLFDGDQSQRLAAIGHAVVIDTPQVQPLYASDQFVVPMPLGSARSAVLQLLPPPGETFPEHASLVVTEVVPLLQVFLAGALRRDPAVSLESPSALFEARIGEELERAKRFDLGLSMLLIDVDRHAVDSRVVREVMAGMRAELRGSDILGVVRGGRIAALLVHTDVAGVSAVVGRVRRRLAALLQAVGLPELRLGRAVLSSECQTTSELLSRASRDVEAVVAT
jgi:GGDEF domain-containing protein